MIIPLLSLDVRFQMNKEEAVLSSNLGWPALALLKMSYVGCPNDDAIGFPIPV